MSLTLDFFAASNSGDGFFSLFEQLYDGEYKGRVGLIFGGPGTGKSTLCRKLLAKSEACGNAVELIHCSSDPDSLDGVICERAGIIVLDATPPHTVVPKLAGVIEQVINIGDCWDRKKLFDLRGEISDITGQIKAGYKKVYGYLSCAAGMQRSALCSAQSRLNAEKAEIYAQKLAKKYMNGSERRAGRLQPRFLSAVTPKGVVSYPQTVEKLADTVIKFNDVGLAASQLILSQLCRCAEAYGYDGYICYDPLLPTLPRQLIIPGLRLAFLCGDTVCCEKEKKLNVGRLYDDPERKNRLLSLYHLVCDVMIKAASAELAQIKLLHDRLEENYTSAMDFAALDSLTKSTVEEYIL